VCNELGRITQVEAEEAWREEVLFITAQGLFLGVREAIPVGIGVIGIRLEVVDLVAVRQAVRIGIG
jgi:hypothetical protein